MTAVEMGKSKRTRKRVRACAEGVLAREGRRTAAATAALGAAVRGKMYSESIDERGESRGEARKSEERFLALE